MSYEDEQDAHLRRLRGNPVEAMRDLAQGLADQLGLQVDHAGFDAMASYVSEPVHARPEEPQGADHVWYRGWEVGYDSESATWAGQGWRAYKGGCDLDAPEVMATTYQDCLNEIDDQEDDA